MPWQARAEVSDQPCRSVCLTNRLLQGDLAALIAHISAGIQASGFELPIGSEQPLIGVSVPPAVLVREKLVLVRARVALD